MARGAKRNEQVVPGVPAGARSRGREGPCRRRPARAPLPRRGCCSRPARLPQEKRKGACGHLGHEFELICADDQQLDCPTLTPTQRLRRTPPPSSASLQSAAVCRAARWTGAERALRARGSHHLLTQRPRRQTRAACGGACRSAAGARPRCREAQRSCAAPAAAARPGTGRSGTRPASTPACGSAPAQRASGGLALEFRCGRRWH